jgi:hypothetical protein
MEQARKNNRNIYTAFIDYKKAYDSVLWRTINLGRPIIELTSKCEAGIMFN